MPFAIVMEYQDTKVWWTGASWTTDEGHAALFLNELAARDEIARRRFAPGRVKPIEVQR